MIPSLAFFTLFLLILIPTSLRRLPLLVFCSGIFLYLIVTVFHLTCDYFTGDGVTLSVLYHLRTGLRGADFSSYSRLIVYGIASILLSLLCVAALFNWKNKEKGSNKLLLACTATLVLSLITHPFFTHLVRIFLASHGKASYKIEEFISHNPISRKKHDHQKNLIIIYLESLEHTYFDQTLFPNLVTQLRSLEHKGLSFTDIRQLNASWWTIGGMVASQCGVPLVTPSHGNSMSGVTDFYPGAQCLGDILKENGYSLTFMGGADINFAGKGAFLKTHGYDSVLGSGELNAATMKEEERFGWGIHDDKLFALAWDKALQLAAQPEQPFVLTLLTLDTHHPNGFPSASCKDLVYQEGKNPMLNTIRCADSLAGAFVQKILHSPLADDTIIVLLSDHLAMKNAATHLLNQTARKNFFLIITPDRQTGSISRSGSSLDIAPTILHLLGFTGRLGLGVDLLQNSDTVPSLVTRVEKPDQVLMEWKEHFLDLWNFPSLARGFSVDPARNRIIAGNKEYSLPLLMVGDNTLKTTCYFPNQNKSLFEYLLDQRPDHSFFLIEPCQQMWFLLPGDTGRHEICLAAGKLGSTIEVNTIPSEKMISANQVAEIAARPATPRQYEKNMRNFFSRIMGPEIVWMFDEIPRGGTIYIIKGKYGKYPNRYEEMPWIKKRNIKCVRNIPIRDDFYFLSRDISRDRQYYKKYILEIYRSGIQLIDYLRQHLDDTIIISAKDEASLHLSAATRSFFKQLGVDLENLGFRDSFACVLHEGKLVDWKHCKKSAVLLDEKKMHQIGIDAVMSAGKNSGNKSSIIIKGKDVSPNQRGLNIVVLERDRLLQKIVFDTFVHECTGPAIIHAIPDTKRF